MVYPLPIPCQRFHHKSQRRILHALDRSVISQRNPSPRPLVHFFPLFLIPWLPVLRGPLLPFAFAAISALALASIPTYQ
jgi:hypothetical protein